jgi:hypothetical protein
MLITKISLILLNASIGDDVAFTAVLFRGFEDKKKEKMAFSSQNNNFSE